MVFGLRRRPWFAEETERIFLTWNYPGKSGYLPILGEIVYILVS